MKPFSPSTKGSIQHESHHAFSNQRREEANSRRLKSKNTKHLPEPNLGQRSSSREQQHGIEDPEAKVRCPTAELEQGAAGGNGGQRGGGTTSDG
jgi:hypothetical protein